MSIKEKSIKIKGLEVKESYITIGILLVASLLSFYTGRLSADTTASPVDHIPMTMTHTAPISSTPSSLGEAATTTVLTPTTTNQVTTSTTIGAYVGSRNGTKYHLPSCPGGLKISDKNKIWFSSKEDAASKGYTPASNCKGM